MKKKIILLILMFVLYGVMLYGEENKQSTLVSDITVGTTGVLDYNILLDYQVLSIMKVKSGIMDPGYFLHTGNTSFYLLPSLSFKNFEFGFGMGGISSFNNLLMALFMRVGNEKGFMIRFELYNGLSGIFSFENILPIVIESGNVFYMKIYTKFQLASNLYFYLGNNSYGAEGEYVADSYTLYNKGAFGKLFSGVYFQINKLGFKIQGSYNGYLGKQTAELNSNSVKYEFTKHEFTTYEIYSECDIKMWQMIEPFCGVDYEFNNTSSLFALKTGIKINLQ